jgi:hypothetical protein
MDMSFLGCDAVKIIILIFGFLITEVIRMKNGKDYRKLISDLANQK